MLVDFRVKNCLSYKDETLFSMVAGSRIRKLKDTHTMKFDSLHLVKSAFIFGPNGSGKSNLFTAIKILRSLLFNFENLNNVKQLRLPYQPFKLGGQQGKPTEFMISLFLDGVLYDYEVQYNASQVLYEGLTKTTKSLKEQLFNRQWDGTEYLYETAESTAQELTKYTRNNTAFLSVLNVFNDPDATKIFDWFLHKILFLDEANRLSSHPLIRKLEEEPFKKEVMKLLKIADFSIQDVTARRVERREKNTIGYDFDTPEVIQEVDIDLHYLSFDEEGAPIGTETINWTMDSKGTVRMLHLACVMVDAYNKGKTIFIDEFDTAFHVSICEFLMAIMNSKRNVTNQFVVTSHEIDLLDQPLRSDQIWFVNKSFKNESELYSLFDFADLQKKRGDISYAKRYLKGEFGATPVINEYLSDQYLTSFNGYPNTPLK
ncbi:abortive phage resistance protein [Lysinibacillus sphaericus]|uniref:AAA family ATPase n=1 Tax=Lysinibacillus sphaericus TaxID=1421 RepID=UPI0018CDAB18|nr:ATP-binding protein [Lysinibacillus sphaericus]MBG9454910.1 abortive phage resistance protein [Lysinibacillus sphaericus]MBG9478339.1 abortive phage resistance protein [Lysinibacillus sphaericus]MBG9591051.1 abortive phage resistance protein [Lysinibacillus sphaericus]